MGTKWCFWWTDAIFKGKKSQSHDFFMKLTFDFTFFLDIFGLLGPVFVSNKVKKMTFRKCL
jgi:hypothetical protein